MCISNKRLAEKLGRLDAAAGLDLDTILLFEDGFDYEAYSEAYDKQAEETRLDHEFAEREDDY